MDDVAQCRGEETAFFGLGDTCDRTGAWRGIMRQMLVIAEAQDVRQLVRSLRGRGIPVSKMLYPDQWSKSQKVALFITVPDHRLSETYETIAASG